MSGVSVRLTPATTAALHCRRPIAPLALCRHTSDDEQAAAARAGQARQEQCEDRPLTWPLKGFPEFTRQACLFLSFFLSCWHGLPSLPYKDGHAAGVLCVHACAALTLGQAGPACSQHIQLAAYAAPSCSCAPSAVPFTVTLTCVDGHGWAAQVEGERQPSGRH